MTTATKPAARSENHRKVGPALNGLPDPRPVTDYTLAVTGVGLNTRVTVTLGQPCVVRAPAWAFIDCGTGGRGYAASVTVVDNRTFYFMFPGVLNPAVGVVEVPYQDPQVQNFAGGFVAPGGRWFRKPEWS